MNKPHTIMVPVQNVDSGELGTVPVEVLSCFTVQVGPQPEDFCLHKHHAGQEKIVAAHIPSGMRVMEFPDTVEFDIAEDEARDRLEKAIQKKGDLWFSMMIAAMEKLNLSLIHI